MIRRISGFCSPHVFDSSRRSASSASFERRVADGGSSTVEVSHLECAYSSGRSSVELHLSRNTLELMHPTIAQLDV
jgi:hypothetical protein